MPAQRGCCQSCVGGVLGTQAGENTEVGEERPWVSRGPWLEGARTSSAGKGRGLDLVGEPFLACLRTRMACAPAAVEGGGRHHRSARDELGYAVIQANRQEG